MRPLFRMGLHQTVMLMQAAACVAGLATLLTFPALRPHQYLNHFRAPDLSCEAGVHRFVDQSKNNLAEEIVASYRESRTVPRLVPQERMILAVAEVKPGTVIVPALAPLRLKLGPPGPAPADPLL